MHKSEVGASFKNLSTFKFNLAMLGNQGRKSMTNPNLLIARLYKAKYFPKCNFLDSTLEHRPSFVLRSICSPKSILRAEHGWKTGSGEDISTWNKN